MSLDEFEKISRNVYIEGEWNGYKYFNGIRTVLIDELRLVDECTSPVEMYRNKIKEQETVSIHFRRGDYVSNPHAAKFHCLCSIEYYENAIAYMHKKIGAFNIIIFSDDTSWVKDNFVVNDAIQCIYAEDLDDVDEFDLMSRCQHNIIANSSFSWFSSWLNTNDDKMVVAPKYWVNDLKINDYIIDGIEDEYIYFLEN
jgi:hypothetical protein